MDKLKSVLSGEESRREDRTILETVNEASSLSWTTRLRGFIVCFIIGVGCTVLGVGCLFLPKIGITLFIVFYTFGNICTLGRLVPQKNVKKCFYKFYISISHIFLWKNFGLALLFVILQVLSFDYLLIIAPSRCSVSRK
uniref:Vesicle transport protein n=1 Tax=Periophthalmus magnuspinnatus TaxID=409849 RepID=A0A3B4BC69_9GOBI